MKTKKLIVGMLMFITTIICFTIFNTTEAASGLGYLKIVRDRTATENYVPSGASTEGPYEVTYRHQLYTNNPKQTKNVWKIVTSTKTGNITNIIPDLYCLRAGLGFTNLSGDADNSEPVLYDQAFDMDEAGYKRLQNYLYKSGNTDNTEITIFKEDEIDNFNSVLWILDHMLLEDASKEEVEAYLLKYAAFDLENRTGYLPTDFENKPLTVLSKADIEAIQQLALWYFTNAEEELYHNKGENGEEVESLLTTLFVKMNSNQEFYNTYSEETSSSSEKKHIYQSYSDKFDIVEERRSSKLRNSKTRSSKKIIYYINK